MFLFPAAFTRCYIGCRKAQGELRGDQTTPRVVNCNKSIWMESIKKLKPRFNNLAKHITFSEV